MSISLCVYACVYLCVPCTDVEIYKYYHSILQSLYICTQILTIRYKTNHCNQAALFADIVNIIYIINIIIICTLHVDACGNRLYITLCFFFFLYIYLIIARPTASLFTFPPLFFSYSYLSSGSPNTRYII